VNVFHIISWLQTDLLRHPNYFLWRVLAKIDTPSLHPVRRPLVPIFPSVVERERQPLAFHNGWKDRNEDCCINTAVYLFMSVKILGILVQ